MYFFKPNDITKVINNVIIKVLVDNTMDTYIERKEFENKIPPFVSRLFKNWLKTLLDLSFYQLNLEITLSPSVPYLTLDPSSTKYGKHREVKSVLN